MTTHKIIKIVDKTYSKQDLLEHKTFCVLPWVHFHAWPDGRVYPCCQTNYRSDIDQYTGQSFSDIMNNDEFKKIRVDMLDGKKPMKYCSYCFNAEEKFDQTSPRNHKNQQFLDDHFDVVAKALESTTASGEIDFNLRYYDIRFSNICNLKCRTCGPNLSSTWASEAMTTRPNGLSEYPLIKKNGIIKINDISKSILDEILTDETLSGLKQLYFAGGEPLVMAEHYQILEGLIRLGNTKVKLMYNTNFTKLTFGSKDVLDLWEHFPDLHIGTSIDDVGDRLFYTRSGAVWTDVVNNFKRFHARIPGSKFKIYNSITVSIFNVFYLPEIIAEFYAEGLIHKDNDWSTHLNMVFDPDYFSVTALPLEFKKVVEAKLNKFVAEYDFGNDKLKKNLIDRIEYTIDLMNSKDDSHMMGNAAFSIFQYDKIRNENFLECFKEANTYLKLEEYAADSNSGRIS